MAEKIVVDIIDPLDGEIKVTHTFWGRKDGEARTHYTHHLASCEYFLAAVEAGNVIEEEFEIDEREIPEGEEVDPDEDEDDEEIPE